MNFKLYESLLIKSKELGFIKIGFTRPHRPLHFDYFLEWLKNHKNADMHWLNKYKDIRAAPAKIIKNCNTIICLAYPYCCDIPATPEGICTARYSEPTKEDYHIRLKNLCNELVKLILKYDPDAKNRICIDSAPILERDLAYSAGIGFIGKNNMLIVPGIGSYIFLAEIFTSSYIPFPEQKPMLSQCGSCDKCVKACPTGALIAAYNFDARNCLSYLTIEYKGDLPYRIGDKMLPFFYGCDKCQSVCPFNPKDSNKYICLPSIKNILDMEEYEFKMFFGKTALSRGGIFNIKRNLKALLNSI